MKESQGRIMSRPYLGRHTRCRSFSWVEAARRCDEKQMEPGQSYSRMLDDSNLFTNKQHSCSKHSGADCTTHTQDLWYRVCAESYKRLITER